jgi:cysteine desulfurase
MSILYLDHASTTPCRKEVWEAMASYALEDYGNPDSLHSLGRSARKAVENARQTIAEQLGCSSMEIIFTSGGSESDNLALRGVARCHSRGHIITSKIEHLAVLHTCESLEAEGFEVTYLDVDEYGLVTPEQVLQSVREDTVLISVAHTNNEIGTIQPIAAITELIKRNRPDIIIHTDAVQAVGHIEIDVKTLGVDLLSFTAQKFYGPKGIGGLYVREGVSLRPRVAGVRKERALELGTLSVPLIVGMALALKRACQEIQSECEYWTPIRNRVIEGLLSIEGSSLNGHPIERLSTNISMCFPGVSGEDVVLHLDRQGICASTGSACTTGTVEPSHVLTAMGNSRQRALGALRLSFGEGSREVDPSLLVERIRHIVQELRSTHYSILGNHVPTSQDKEVAMA